MKLDDKHIDQLFNDAAQKEKAPAYSSSYWEEMSGIIQARTARKKRLLAWIFIGTGACLLFITSLVLLNQQTTSVRYAQNSIDSTSLKVSKVAPNKSNSMNSALVKSTSINEAANGMSRNVDRTKEAMNPSKENSSSSTLHTNEITQVNKTTHGRTSVPVKENSTLNTATMANKNNPNNASSQTNVPSAASNPNTASVKNRQDVFRLTLLTPRIVEHISTTNNGDMVLKKLNYSSGVRYRLYANLGGGLMENYKTKSPFQSGSFDLKLGFETEIHNLLIRTGIGSQVTTNADLIVSKRTKVETFKVVEYQSDLSYQRMIDLYVPVELGYNLKKVSFGVGVQENYLLTSKMEASYYTDHVLTGTKNLYGNTDGLHRFSTQGYVWAEYRISPLFSVGAKVGTSLTTRIKEGKYFNHSASTNPLYGQLTLRFDFLK